MLHGTAYLSNAVALLANYQLDYKTFRSVGPVFESNVYQALVYSH